MKYGLFITVGYKSRLITNYSYLPHFNFLKENSLKDIFKFTTTFLNEDNLKEFLYNSKLLSKSELEGKVSIRSLGNQEKHIILPYVPYAHTKPYFNTHFLNNFLTSVSNDKTFLDIFTKFFKKQNLTPKSKLIMDNILKVMDCCSTPQDLPSNMGMLITKFANIYIEEEGLEGLYVITYLIEKFQEVKEQEKRTTPIKHPNEEETRIRHLKYLLQDNPTEEERISYEAEIQNIEKFREINLGIAMDNIQKLRRKKTKKPRNELYD